MDEESRSWIRRTKFSHTVYHQGELSRLASVPIRFDPGSQGIGLLKIPEPETTQVELNPLTNKQRSVSPLPSSPIPDTFREARSETKRFSTPYQRRKEPDSPGSTGTPESSPLKSSSPLRGFGKAKMKKDFSWAKFFDHARGRVTVGESIEKHMVDLKMLNISNKFASGADSRLYHAKYKGKAAAVKLMVASESNEARLLASRLKKQFTREVTFLSRLHHPNVIKFLAAWKNPPVYFIVTEYLSEGSLRAFLHRLDHTTIPLENMIPLALEIARGMEYVHSQGVIHRDLKPENILIDQDFHMKIADFGIACEEIHCDPFDDDPGTYRWMAPEMIRRKHYGRKVDVYSFGLMLWELVSGSVPFGDMSPIVVAFAVLNKNLRPAFSKDCPPAMKALIEQCWSLQPDKRPEFWQIVKVLEKFESSLSHDGTLKLVQSSICLDKKKGFFHWIQKLSPPRSHSTSVPKPRFA